MPLQIPSLLDEARLTGQLLIAMPAMDDPRFAQSVIYLCAHTEDGAMGLVLNRPLVSPTFADLLRQLDVTPRPPARSITLCDGGPIDGARGFVLHTADWTGDGSLQVDDTMALGTGRARAFWHSATPTGAPGNWTRRSSPMSGSPHRPRSTWCSTPTTRPSGAAPSPPCGWTRPPCPAAPATPDALSGSAGHA